MAVTVTRSRSVVVGDRRWALLNVNISATGQTFATPYHGIEASIADGSGTVAVEASVSTPGGNGPVTFAFTGGGAQNNVDFLMIGR